MSRKAKGKRPVYFDDPANDKLLAFVMALVGEVSVLRDRLDTIEHVAAARGAFSSDDIETYKPTAEVIAAREVWRAEYLQRVLRIIHHDRESAAKGETAEAYQKAIAEVS